MEYPLPLIGFCAYSGTGKTTLLKQILPLLIDNGLRIGMVKHAHHQFDIDHPGKDSYELRKAGAQQMLIVSSQRTAMIRELHTPQQEPNLFQALQQLDHQSIDLVLVEGFKSERFPKIELHRPALGNPLMFPNDPNIIAVASDATAEQLEIKNYPSAPPLLDINSPKLISAFILDMINRRTQNSQPIG